MNLCNVAGLFCLGLLLLPICSTDAQITVNSVLISGEANTGGDSSQGIVSDSDSFLLDMFSNFAEASAQSGVPLNASVATAGAGAGFDGSEFTFETFISVDQLSPPLTADATAFVEIDFSLDSSHVLLFSTSEDTAATGLSNFTFSSNSLLLRGGVASQLGSLSSGQILGPGSYVLRSETTGVANSDFFFERADSFGSLRLTAVPEPSSLLCVSAFCVVSLMRRRR